MCKLSQRMKFNAITKIFSLVLLADLLVIGADLPHYLRYLTKPAITIVLMAYVWTTLKKAKKLRYFLILALIFSLTGDILLLRPLELSWYFTGGLLAFLFAHLMYISAFFKIEHFKSSKTFFFSIFLLFYAMLIFKFIGGTLGELLPYVILYMLVLLLMVLTAFIRKTAFAVKSYGFVLTGAFLFMISDSLLALNKFHQAFALADILIMLTYGWAQFLIIYGAVHQHKTAVKLK